MMYTYQVDAFGFFTAGRALEPDAEIPAGWHAADDYQQQADLAAYRLRLEAGKVVPASAQDTADRLARLEAARPGDEIAARWRAWRAKQLAQTDHAMLLDAPYTADCIAALEAHRQALRDIPQGSPDPRTWARPACPPFVKR